MLTASPAARKIVVLADADGAVTGGCRADGSFLQRQFQIEGAGREYAISYEVALASTGDDLKITSTTSGPHKPSGSRWDEDIYLVFGRVATILAMRGSSSDGVAPTS